VRGRNPFRALTLRHKNPSSGNGGGIFLIPPEPDELKIRRPLSGLLAEPRGFTNGR